MADKRDYYEVLGVPKDADEAAIKKHTVYWRKNIIQMQTPVMKRLQKSLRKPRKHTGY